MHKFIGILLVMFCLCGGILVTVDAQETRVRESVLLAVSENLDDVGTTARLVVELVPGQGRVFMDTAPLSKFDTQISTRLAKEIACAYTQADCMQYDFIYTIHSDAPIIGGPSAGGAIAALTVAALLDLPVSDQVALTGTINSGGIIGPVGGVNAKIRAAGRAGLETVMIPSGTRFSHTSPPLTAESDLNVSLVEALQNYSDAYEVGRRAGIRVIEVATLDDAVNIYTGGYFVNRSRDYDVPDFYRETMFELAQNMCSRAQVLDDLLNETPTNAAEQMERGRQEIESGRFYSAASFCFGASTRLRTAYLEQFNADELAELIVEVRRGVDAFVLPDLHGITDLQASMLVQERIQESDSLLDLADESLETMQLVDAQRYLAFAIERLESANSWSLFFGNPGADITIDTPAITAACQQKLVEAEERRQYVAYYMPSYGVTPVDSLEKAYEQQREGHGALCLFYASQAKANYDTVIGVLSVRTDEEVRNVLDIKLQVAEEVIAQATADNMYPIISFSFVEYAHSLGETDVNSALLYAQYAMEFADFSSYFTGERSQPNLMYNPPMWRLRFDLESFFFGIAAGLLLASFIFFVDKKRHLRRINANNGRTRTKTRSNPHRNAGQSRKKR